LGFGVKGKGSRVKGVELNVWGSGFVLLDETL